MKIFDVSVRGIAPLMQARHLTPAEEHAVTNRASSGKKKMKDFSDEEQMALHSYKNKKGQYIQMSEMFEAALVKAATSFKMEGKKSYKDVFKSGILIDPIEIVHESQKFTLDGRWGKNPNTGGAVWVVRPRIEQWSLSFEIQLLQDERVSNEILKEILEYAGIFVGVGSWRPKYGRFEVTKFAERVEKKSKSKK
jgi:hypothetical protein